MADIRKLVDDPENGYWQDREDFRVFTPNMSLFDKVEPMELAKFFDDSDTEFLNMP